MQQLDCGRKFSHARSNHGIFDEIIRRGTGLHSTGLMTSYKKVPVLVLNPVSLFSGSHAYIFTGGNRDERRSRQSVSVIQRACHNHYGVIGKTTSTL